ncbi:MAG: amidohydrolase family protein [Candidatus Latescibacterota bacterium]|nr:amidohydrolase family protein [Candidatus Latescibacterota bacterium]
MKLEYTDFDRDIWSRELEEFVPQVIYDMHTHIWSDQHRGSNAPRSQSGLRQEYDYQDHLTWAANLYPDREMHYLIIGTPVVDLDAQGHNDWMAQQMTADPASAVNMLVTPDMTAEYVAEQVRKHRFLGLKPYRLFAPDPANARILDFLPEHLIELAHDMKLAITMHLSKPTGPADANNQRDLERYTRQYPGAQWILAHCARAFNSFMMEEAIHFLTGLPNIWYDSSAVNDMYSHFLLMKHEDRSRVMFGSDNIVAGCERGKYVTYARAWYQFAGFADLPHCDPRATLVIYEQLRQERQVADILGLTKDEVENHFAGNARRFISQMRAQQRN